MESKNNDFVQLSFVGKVLDGDVFDTNISSEAKKIGLKIEDNPLVVCIGQDMVISGFDKSLENKEFGKKYFVTLSPENAFGPRDSKLIKLMPLKLFKEKNISPYPGLTLSLDNMIVRIVSVSGGRVLVDFNNPLAGKTIEYEFTLLKKVDDLNEKINSIISFFLRQKLDFEIDQTNNKIIFKLSKAYKPIISMLNEKFKDILQYQMELKEDNSLSNIPKNNQDNPN